MSWKNKLRKEMGRYCPACEGEGCFKCNYEGFRFYDECPDCKKKTRNYDCKKCKGKGYIKEYN